MSDSLKKIGDFCKIRRGASPRPIGDPNYFGGDVGWIRISDVTKSKKYLRSTEQYLSPLGVSKSVRVNPGDLIMSICATIGRPIIVGIPACIHDGFVQLHSFREGTFVDYFYYLLQFHEKGLESKGQPGTQVNINTGIVEKYLAFIPSLPEQKKITEILSIVDHVIELTEKQISLTTNLLLAQTEALLSPDASNRSQSPMQIVKMGDLLEFKNGVNASGDKYGFGVPFVNLMDVLKRNRLYVRNLNGLVSLGESDFKNFQLRFGDILFGRTSETQEELGMTAVFMDQSDCVFGGFVIRGRPKDDRIHHDVAPYLYRSSFVRQQIIRMGQGAVRANIGQDQLSKILVPIPIKAKQEEAAKLLSGIENFRSRLNDKATSWRHLKSALMSDLLSGRIKVKAKQ